MSIFGNVRTAIETWVTRRFLQEEVARFIASRHLPTVMKTLRQEFPELQNDRIPVTLVRSIVRRANERLIEHIV